MSSMESFYGGRQGASFVIVKRFDGIDIPQPNNNGDYTYRAGWYAKDQDGYFYVPLIERTSLNVASYPGWGTIPKDGVTTVMAQDGSISNPLPLEYAEGMKQCFEKGGATISEVGYGEYVIIDTVFGLCNQSGIDNGKIYRRGMNYDQDLGGAEYIGQIVGPSGGTTEINMTTIENIMSKSESQVQEYHMVEGDQQDGIVPGKYKDSNIGDIHYNDVITYGWATIRDDQGNATGTFIGFTFPYLVPEITSVKRSPYYTMDDYIKGRITDLNLIGTAIEDIDNFDLFIDNGLSTSDRDPSHGDTGHAFYRKWKLSVPQGIKGDTQTQLEIVPQKIRVDSDLWSSTDITQPPAATADDNTYVILDDDRFQHDCVYPYDDTSAIVAVEKDDTPGVTYYAKIEDTYMLKFRYRQTWYDEYEDGSDYSMIDLGDYNTIRKIWLADDGYVWVRYNADEDGIINPDTPIPRIESMALANRTNPSSFDPEGNLVNSGHFRIIYNNDGVTNKTGTWTDPAGDVHAIWETDITWPQSVSLNTEGLLKFLYNNNLYYDQTIYTDPTAGTYEFSIPWITNALIKQNGDFTLTYNNEVNAGTYPASEWDSVTHTWTTKLNFIDHVTIDHDGIIHFWYSNGKEAPNTGYANIKIKYLVNAEVETGLDTTSTYDFDGEGSGDQKIHLTWNTGNYFAVTPVGTEDPSAENWYELINSNYELSTDIAVDPTKTYYEFLNDTQKIGAPLNYIMEAIVTTYDSKAPNTPANHLLVLYSDPDYRAWLKSNYQTTDPKTNKIWSYTSQKFTQADPANPGATIFVTRDDWFDLGYVKGEPGGLHIIGEYQLNPGETYKNYLDDNIPPENMPGNTPEDRGWAYIISKTIGASTSKTIYTYDYLHSQWILVGDLNSVSVDPTQSLIMDEEIPDPTTGSVKPKNSIYTGLPKEQGLWFIQYDIKSVY